jgi:hypothetical protein
MVSPPVAVFTATEYAFSGPDTLRAGATTLRLESAGAELHHLQLVRFEEGHTLDEFMAAASMGGAPPAWAHPEGGPNPPAPGGTSEATVVLTPGNWAVICLVPAPDGMPHVAKGMSKPFTVLASSAPAAEPAATVTMTLRDYDFDLSTPLTAGSHSIRVENSAAQPHEVILVKLDEGKTVQDMVDYIQGMEGGAVAGPPPATPMGGMAALAQGAHAWFSATLTPGEWGLLCVVPDAGDGRPHTVHGMARQFTIP